MGVTERKEREKEEMRQFILKTAMGLFLEEGFYDVSIRRIAEKMEYSPAAIYRYFPDRDDILFALHNEGFEELYKRQQEVVQISDIRKRLLKHGELYIKFGLENPEYYNLMFIMRSPFRKVEGDTEKWQNGMRSYQFFRDDVERGIAEGALKGESVDVMALALWAQVHGLVALILRQRCPMIDPDELPKMALSAYRAMMANIGLAAVAA